MDTIEELDDPHVPIAQACAALGVSRATLHRQTQPATPPALHEPAPSPRRLSDPERQAVLDASEPGVTPTAAARPQPLTSQSRNAPLNAIHS